MKEEVLTLLEKSKANVLSNRAASVLNATYKQALLDAIKRLK